MEKVKSKTLIGKWKINRKIREAAAWIDANYSDDDQLVLVGLLKGCIPFLGRLIPQIKTELELDFLVVSSFKGNDKAVGKPEIITDLVSDIRGKSVLLVEDIVDSGYTIKYVKDFLFTRGPKSVKVITLLDKPSGRKVDLEPDYSCFAIKDKFIFGFGLDYKEKLRNLPCIKHFV